MSFCTTFCCGKFHESSAQTFFIFNWLEWSFNDKEKLTNFETTLTGPDIALDMFRSFLTPLIGSWTANFEVMVTVSEHAWRSAFTSTVCDPLDTFTGSTCRMVVVFGMLVFLWLMLLLIDTCRRSCLWRSAWCFLPQLFALHFNLHIYCLVVWSFEKQFLHKLLFCSKSLFYWFVRRCFYLHNQQLIFS